MKSRLLILSDEELLRLVAGGDQNAFDVIFGKYWKKLYSYAYKIYREEQVCEDIVQEIFISLWNKSQSVIILNLEAYLFKSVKYKIANHIRSLKFTKDHLDILEGMESPHKTISSIEYQEFEAGVMNEINKLSPKCREVFILSRIESLSNSEIASKLNLSVHTVEKHISNALKELRASVGILKYHLIVILVILL